MSFFPYIFTPLPKNARQSPSVECCTDNPISGRSVAIVPRDENPNGYFDLELDDLDEYSALGKMMKKFLALRVKMQPK